MLFEGLFQDQAGEPKLLSAQNQLVAVPEVGLQLWHDLLVCGHSVRPVRLLVVERSGSFGVNGVSQAAFQGVLCLFADVLGVYRVPICV